MSESAPTLAYLLSLLAPLRYYDKQRVATDVLALIKNTNSLQIKIGQFVHANGAADTLLSLSGTIPIDYRGGSYNIPVTLWIGDAYPMRPPSCFVTPTRDMRIKDGHLHVDHFGVVYLPYLNQWAAQSSNLIEMVTIMSSVFSQDPPVFKVPANALPPQPAPQQPPRPANGPQPAQPAFGAQAGAARAGAAGGVNYVNPYAQNQPLSAHSASMSPPVAQRNFSEPVLSQQQQQQNNAAVQSPAASPASAHSQPQQPAQQQQQQQQDPRATKKNQLIATLTLRMRTYLTDELSAKTLLVDDLLQSQAQVEAHGAAVAAETAALQAQLARVREAQQQLSAQNDELSRWLAENEKRELPHVDLLVQPKDTWSKQMLDAVALDSALEDAYYVLDRALQDERMDLPAYTKQLRALSRKQFLARALVKQIQMQQQQQAPHGLPAAAAQQPAASSAASQPAQPPSAHQRQVSQEPSSASQPQQQQQQQPQQQGWVPPPVRYEPPVHRAQLGGVDFVMQY